MAVVAGAATSEPERDSTKTFSLRHCAFAGVTGFFGKATIRPVLWARELSPRSAGCGPGSLTGPSGYADFELDIRRSALE